MNRRAFFAAPVIALVPGCKAEPERKFQLDDVVIWQVPGISGIQNIATIEAAKTYMPHSRQLRRRLYGIRVSDRACPKFLAGRFYWVEEYDLIPWPGGKP